MKTLDEVIKAIEVYPNSFVAGKIIKADALYYLKEYQKIEDEYEELKDWWAEEHAENVPLSWDELKQMEGKPVWVEESAENGLWWTYWVIWEGDNAVLPKKDYSTKWRAYRKERK